MGIEHFRQAEPGVSRQVCRAGGGSRFDQAVIHADKEARAAADRAKRHEAYGLEKPFAWRRRGTRIGGGLVSFDLGPKKRGGSFNLVGSRGRVKRRLQLRRRVLGNVREIGRQRRRHGRWLGLGFVDWVGHGTKVPNHVVRVRSDASPGVHPTGEVPSEARKPTIGT
jgi:hypothetical protein